MIHNIDYQNGSKYRNSKVGSNSEEQDLKGQKGAVCSESTLLKSLHCCHCICYCRTHLLHSKIRPSVGGQLQYSLGARNLRILDGTISEVFFLSYNRVTCHAI